MIRKIVLIIFLVFSVLDAGEMHETKQGIGISYGLAGGLGLSYGVVV